MPLHATHTTCVVEQQQQLPLLQHLQLQRQPLSAASPPAGMQQQQLQALTLTLMQALCAHQQVLTLSCSPASQNPWKRMRMSPMQQPVLDPRARPQQQAAGPAAGPQHSSRSSCRTGTGRHSTSPGQAPASSAMQQQLPQHQQTHTTHSRTAGSSHSAGLQEPAAAAALLNVL